MDGGGGGRVGRRDVEMRTTLVRADGRVVERPDGNRLLVDAYNVLRRDHDALRAEHALLRDELDRAQATTPRTNGGDAVDGAISAEEAAALKGRVARLVLDTDKGCDVVSTVRGAIGDVLGRFFKDALEQVAGTADAASIESLATNPPDTSYTSSAGGATGGDDDPLQQELRLLQQAKDTLIMVLTTAAAEHRRSSAQLRSLHDADARRAAEAAEASARAAIESEAHEAALSELSAQLQLRSSAAATTAAAAAAAAAATTTTTTAAAAATSAAAARRNSTSGLRSVSPLATAVAAAAAAAATAFESHPNPPTQQQQTPVPPPASTSPRNSLHFSSASPSAGDAAAPPPPPDEPRTLEKVRSGGPRVVGARRALSANRRAHERFSTSGPHERLDNTTSTTTSAALRGGDDVVTSPRRLRRYGRNDESGDADGGGATEIPTIGVLLEVGGKVSASVSDAFHVGDIIMSGDGRTVITQQDFANIVAAANGGNVSCRVRRNGTNKTVEFRLKRGVATAAKKLPAKVKQPTKLKQKK